jgi:hypothetical protein
MRARSAARDAANLVRVIRNSGRRVRHYRLRGLVGLPTGLRSNFRTPQVQLDPGNHWAAGHRNLPDHADRPAPRSRSGSIAIPVKSRFVELRSEGKSAVKGNSFA